MSISMPVSPVQLLLQRLRSPVHSERIGVPLVVSLSLLMTAPRTLAQVHKPLARASCVVLATPPATQPSDPQQAITGGDNKHVTQWDVTPLVDPAQKLFTYQKDHGKKVSYVAVSLKAKELFTASYDHEIRVYVLGKKNSDPVVTFNEHEGNSEVWVVVPSNDGTHAISATNSGEIRYWDATVNFGGPVRTRATVAPSHDPIGGLAFLPNNDSKFLACTGYGQMILYDVNYDAATGKYSLDQETTSFSTGNLRPINSVAITSKGDIAVSGGMDMTVRVWDVKTGQQMMFSPIKDANDTVWRVAISPDDLVFAAASEDGTVRLYNLADGHFLAKADNPGKGVMGVAFVSNCKVIYTATDYNGPAEVRIWDISAFHNCN